MNATVERLAGELRRLPPVELHELWQHIGFTPVSASPVTADQRAALEAVHSLYGRFAGGNMLARLLQERARDRAREDEQLHRSRSNG